MGAPEYQKKPKPLNSNKKEYKCIWSFWMHGILVKCEEKTEGRFFCKKHAYMASVIDSCSYGEYTVGRGFVRGHTIS
jgi:hypothetical protein